MPSKMMTIKFCLTIKKRNNMKMKDRINSKTPKFWKKVQKLGIALVAVGTVITTAPVSLPVGIVTIGGYLLTVGGVTAALSQLTVEKDCEDKQPEI
jgi:uncharacterized membrane protein HdeD (DUF308 family)